MILNRSLALRNLRAQTHAAVLAGAKIMVYTGSMPSGDIVDQTLLVTLTIPDPAGTVDFGAFVLVPGIDAVATGSGVASWVRILDSDDEWLMDLDAGGQDSNAAIIVNPSQIYVGGSVRINQFRLIEP